MSAPASLPQRLPVVVSIGFAGSRMLLEADSALSGDERAAYVREVGERLRALLAELPGRLKWQAHHFGCGISQVAIGADLLFTEACAVLGISQRIFLPQAREEYLSARGSDGSPDFPDDGKAEALRLLASPHIIHERVVSHSKDRICRFEDTNLEILKASDVIVCLIRAGAQGKRGGTSELLDYGKALGKPVLEIQVHEVDGRPEIMEKWHVPGHWAPPELPEDLQGATIAGDMSAPSPGVPASSAKYLDAIQTMGSAAADWRQSVFKRAAFVVIGAHLLATLFALLALKMSGGEGGHGMVDLLLSVELLLLLAGFSVHFALHHSHIVRVWAVCRLSAEISRSVSSLRGLHVHLEHLFKLPFPATLRPLLRTVNVLNLASTKGSPEPWEEKRRHYLESRMDGPDGQIAYYRHKYRDAVNKLRWASRIFNAATVTAFLATAGKLLFHPGAVPSGVLGICAVLLPVLAVGALSLAASFDLEARSHTYQEMLEYLQKIRPLFAAAKSERAFTHLMLQTESRLLGETANWASRRSFTGVT
ncbi:hypothetical protein OVA24_20465 [Luteolibacter sp. SL250]|uniref:hypothetical protein n=1 Tax=Luteolibacter sp. SL250 TaxID=2995170 RepID=UPI00226D8B82|nr:hypothetical protein [Luteolibacter sp. SL250]WAC19596.1 hypothetical protein OVA24_20465 [Luteolibacter sp. SL250]